jgi:hypothetical protein
MQTYKSAGSRQFLRFASALFFEGRAISTRFTFNAFDSLVRNKRNHNQSGDGIGPPEAEESIQSQAAEQDCRQVSAEVCLFGVGVHGPTAQVGGDLVLGAGEERHHDKGSASEDNARDAVLGGAVPQKIAGGFVGDINGEAKEA